MDMRDILRLVEAALTGTKFWFNARTGETIPVDGGHYHADLVANDPERFGLTPHDTPPGADSEDQAIAAFSKGWVRAAATDGKQDPYVHGADLKDLRKALAWMSKQGLIADRSWIEITDPRSASNNAFKDLRGQALDAFIRSGRLVESVQGRIPKPYRVEYPYGPPGDSFRLHAGTSKCTCVALYRGLDPKLLANITPGNRLRYNVSDLANDMRANGYKGGPAQNIFVYVDADGHAKIGEGNHRIAAALQAGITAVDVQVRYQGNSDVDHLLWPFDIDDPSIRVIADD